MTGKPGNSISFAELSAFCDDALSVADTERVVAALESDPALRNSMAQIMADRDTLLANANAEDVHSGVDALAERLQASVDAARRQRVIRHGAVLGAAMVALIALGWAAHTIYSGPVTTPEGIVSVLDVEVPIFVADAAGAHDIFAKDSVHPVEFLAEDSSVMNDWFKTHLGEHAVVPHLEDLGFTLIGGRLLGDRSGATAQIIYRNEANDKVSLFFSKRPVPGGSEVKLAKVGKSYASYWRERELTWAVVEDTPGADVSMIADHVSKLSKEPLKK